MNVKFSFKFEEGTMWNKCFEIVLTKMNVGFGFITVLSIRTVVWNVLKWHLWAYCSLAVNTPTACPSKTNTFIRPYKGITCVPQGYKTLVNLRKDVLL